MTTDLTRLTVLLRETHQVSEVKGLAERLAQGADYVKDNGNHIWRMSVTDSTTGEVSNIIAFGRPGFKGTSFALSGIDGVWEIL